MINPRRHNNCKYLCAQHRSTSVRRQTLTDIKGETDSNTVTVEDFNTPLTAMDRSSKQKINKETQALNGTIHQIDFIDIYRKFHLIAAEYVFFSSVHGTFSRIHLE